MKKNGMKKTGARLSLIGIVFLFAVSIVFAQGGNSLEGKAYLPNNAQPARPVKITLTFSGRRIYETFTDLSGRFSFSGLRSGSYQLTAEGDGTTFETTTVQADVSAFGGSPQSFTQNIQLQPIRGKAATAAGVVSAFSQNVPKAASGTLERAKKIASAGNAELALSLMKEAIKVYPEYFEAHLELGNELLQLNRHDEAIAELDLARQINPNDERVYQSFGIVMLRKKNYAIAVAVFAEASRLNPTNPYNALMRGIALINQASSINPATSPKDAADRTFILERAEVALKQASDLSDRKLTADHLTMAVFYEMKGQPARAADELEEYLNKMPEAKNAEAIRAEIKRLRAPAGK